MLTILYYTLLSVVDWLDKRLRAIQKISYDDNYISIFRLFKNKIVISNSLFLSILSSPTRVISEHANKVRKTKNQEC